jgi:NAD(P)H-flavin reductase
MTDYESIDDFGENILVSTRDAVISSLLKVINGTSKPPVYQKLHSLLGDFSDNQKEILKEFIIDAVDSCMMEFLWKLSENNSGFSLIKQLSNNKYIDLNTENQEGLEGIYLTSIDNTAKYNKVEDILITGEIEKKRKDDA